MYTLIAKNALKYFLYSEGENAVMELHLQRKKAVMLDAVIHTALPFVLWNKLR